jgi:hypothetical protein
VESAEVVDRPSDELPDRGLISLVVLDGESGTACISDGLSVLRRRIDVDVAHDDLGTLPGQPPRARRADAGSSAGDK